MSYTNALKYLGQRITVKIDRPIGSRHPEFDFIYPVNYGYLPGIIGKDGEFLDAYILGIRNPVTHFTGDCIAVISRADDEDKLVVVPPRMLLSDHEIRTATAFQECFFDSVIIRG